MKYLSVVLALSLGTFSSCKKLNLAPTDRFSELNFWESSNNINNALSNVYALAYNSSYYFYNEALSDNAFTKLGVASGVDAISSGNFQPSLPRFLNEWSFHYSGIKPANIFLENVDRNQDISEAVRNRMKAEVLFFRAWHHFNLAKWWGDVPIIDHDITPEEAQQIARSPHADVIAFVLNDLDQAIASLPKKEDYAVGDRGRITKGAAMGLKARVLLYEGRMSEVVDVCEKLMNDPASYGSYALESDYTALFSDENVNNATNESMYSLAYVPTLRTWGDYIDFAPITAGARTNNLAPTQELVDSYIMLNGKSIDEAGSGYDINDPYSNRDPRLKETIVYDQYEWENPDGSKQIIYIEPGTAPAGQGSNEYSNAGQGTATGYYWRKYWDPNYAAPGISSGLNLHIIRWAEILMDYAEAKNELGQMNEEVWNKTIRLIRERAGFTEASALDYPGSSSRSMTDIIRNERRSEFVLEDKRIDDIRRWKIAEDVMNGWAHGARYGDASIDNGYLRVQQRVFDPARHYLWPVPPAEIALNKNLTQNSGY